MYLEGYLFVLEVDSEYARQESDFVTVIRAGRCVKCAGRHVVQQSKADKVVD